MNTGTSKIDTPAGMVTVTIKSGILTLSGPSGTHRVMIDARTNVDAHVAGFVAMNGGRLEFGKIGPVLAESELNEGEADSPKEERVYRYTSEQQITLDGEPVGVLTRNYFRDQGYTHLDLSFYDSDLADADDYIYEYSSPRAALEAKKAEIRAALR
jgi:hypothetical protein|tara:strand:- start:1543 stop:2010 length:468 start_codon:yes stop_codon:yes gene_type:complete